MPLGIGLFTVCQVDLSGQSLPVLTRQTEAFLKPSQTYSAQCCYMRNWQ
jgi:hypothetical protein